MSVSLALVHPLIEADRRASVSNVNTQIRDLFLRRAVRRVRQENDCVARVCAEWRSLVVDLVSLVRSSPHVFTGRDSHITNQYGASTLSDNMAHVIERHFRSMIKCLGEELPLVIRVEMIELPLLLERLLNRAAGAQAISEAVELREDEISTQFMFNSAPIQQAAELLSSPLGGSTFARAFGDLAAGALRNLKNILFNGLASGAGVAEVARNVQSTLGNKRYEAERIVRSEYVRVANQSALLLYQQNRDVLKSVRWHATLDKRTCIQCGSLDGKTWTDPRKAKIPVVSTHANCFVPSTRVEGDFVAATRMLYQGRVRRIVTRQGYTLTVTPNHPVLTASGMRSAHEIRKGDHVLSRSRNVERRAQQEQNAPTSIKEAFEAISSRGRQQTVGVTREDFHGDARGGNGKIDIVFLNRELPDDTHATTFERAGQHALVIPEIHEALHSRTRTFDLLGVGMFAPASSSPRGTELSFDEMAVSLESAPLDSLRIGSSAWIHAALTETTFDHVAACLQGVGERLDGFSRVEAPHDLIGVESYNALPPSVSFDETAMQRARATTGFAREVLDRLPCDIALDEIVEIVDHDYSGHVYDLQSLSGCIVAENIITSNCRCTLIPIVKSARELGLSNPGPKTRASFDGQVPATMTWNRWFPQQSDAFQKDVLGASRFTLYKMGRVPLTGFTTANVRGVRNVRDVIARISTPAKFDAADYLSDEERAAAGVSRRAQRTARVKAQKLDPDQEAAVRRMFGMTKPVKTGPLAFTPAKSLEEAEDFLHHVLGVPVDKTSTYGTTRGKSKSATKQIDLLLANTINKALLRSKAATGVLPQRVLLERMGRDIANYQATTRTMRVNVDAPMWHDSKEILRSYQQKWFASDDPQGPILHEMGHAAHALKRPDLFNPDISTPAKRSALKSLVTNYDKLAAKVGMKVSRYAATDVLEFTAETFSGLMAGKKYPKDVMAAYKVFGGPMPNVAVRTVKLVGKDFAVNPTAAIRSAPSEWSRPLVRGDVFKLTQSQMASALNSDKRDFILKTVIGDWAANEAPTARSRAAMMRLLPHTVGGSLEAYHPGSATIYRGGKINLGKVESYSTSEKMARSFGANVTSEKITSKTPALSFDKVLGQGRSEGEVAFISGAKESASAIRTDVGGGFLKPTSTMKSEPGYHYHATNVSNAQDISVSGLKTHGPSFGTDQSVWPDGSRERRSYFAPANVIHSFAPEDGVSVALRVKTSASAFKREAGTGDIFALKTIRPKDIEIANADGTWRSLESAFRPDVTVPLKAMPPRAKSMAETSKAFTGKQVETKKVIGGPGRFTVIGNYGERIVDEYLSRNVGAVTRKLNATQSNFPIDLATLPYKKTGEKSIVEVIDVKAGEIGNTKAAQQWRITVGLQRGKEVEAKIARMTEKQKTAYYAFKQREAIQEKYNVVNKYKKEYAGKATVVASEYTVIVDADRKLADIYRFEGFHKRLGWTAAETQKAYVTTVKLDFEPESYRPKGK